MNELVQAFILGNGAILTNVCMLPLYPGLIAFLAGNSQNENARRGMAWLGVFVLAGVLTMMTGVGFVLYALQQTVGDILGVLLPIIYIVVIGLGVLMLTGRNPFAGLARSQSPALRNPFLSAYVYGLLLGPMTLPCTGPIIVTAFLLGAGSATELANGLLYFLAFGVGFGWPLVVLPLFAVPLQRRFTNWLAKNHTALTRVSGLLLVGIGIFGIVTEVLPNI